MFPQDRLAVAVAAVAVQDVDVPALAAIAKVLVVTAHRLKPQPNTKCTKHHNSFLRQQFVVAAGKTSLNCR